MTACNLFAARTEKGFVVRVQGKGTSSQSPALADFVKQCFGQDPQVCVAVDLLGCEYLDSTFLGCLLNLQRAGAETRFHVVADETTRKRLLAATQLDSYLTLVAQAPQTQSSFALIDTKPVSERELGQHILQSHEAIAEVPSDVAKAFRRIARQLKSELEKQDLKAAFLDDTVIQSTTNRK